MESQEVEQAAVNTTFCAGISQLAEVMMPSQSLRQARRGQFRRCAQVLLRQKNLREIKC